MTRLLFCSLPVVALLALASPAFGAGMPCFSYQTLNVPDHVGTAWFGINNAGLMVGNYCTYPDCAIGGGPGVIYDPIPGTFESFSVRGYNTVLRAGINDAGTVVGQAVNYSDAWDYLGGAPFVRDPDGIVRMLGLPGGVDSWDAGANDINSPGTVVGSSTIVGWYWDDAQGRYRGVIWKDGVPTAYDATDGHTALMAVSDTGGIVGTVYPIDFSSARGFVDVDGSLTWIEYGQSTETSGINSRGLVTATAWDGASEGVGRLFGVVAYRGAYSRFSMPGAMWTVFGDINDRGVIVGAWGDDVFDNGLVVTPTVCPE